MEYENCPNCNQKIVKTGFFGVNKIDNEHIDFIHVFSDNTSPAYCESCHHTEYQKAKSFFNGEVEKVKKIQTDSLGIIPCVNVEPSKVWDYEIIELVTGQTAMGTGVLSELSSEWNDFFGQESRTLNKKVSKGEQTCLNIMRAKTLALGGNAVIGVDIDYAEVGALRGMILVCTTGTAVRIKNIEVFDGKTLEVMRKLNENTEKLRSLNKYQEYMYTKF